MDELDRDEDPEVVADIKHRYRSERDDRRAREAMNPTDAAKHPALRVVSTVDTGLPKRDPIAEGIRNREKCDRMAELIREYRDNLLSSEREKQVLEGIRFLGHPNIDGLIRAVQDRRLAMSSGKRKGKL
jgi:hypothetical protein